GVEEIVERAGTLGFHAVALTDVNNLYGAVDFYKTARASGIKPILGTQIVHGAASAVLLARNLVGYSNLCRIITRRNLDEKFSLQDALGEFEDGLFILTEDMRLAEALAQKVDPKYLWLEAAVQGRCRTQLQDIHKCAKELGVGVVATGDTYFLNQDDHLLHRVLLAVRENCMVSQVSRVAHPDSYLASGEEMRERFRDFPRALSNTLKIADACNLDLPMGKPIFPKYPLPAGETAHGALHKKCAAGLTWRYSPVSREAVERLTHELSLINTLGFSEYFLIVGDIVDFARGRGIPVVGRGSGAGSIVAYLLGITSVDPLKFNLPFERFLNPGRTDLPDLDIDFCWRLRDDVIDYVYETYGADHVAMISTHNLFRRRSAFREIAKSFGISNDMISRMGRRLAKVDNTGGHHEASLSDVPVSDETIKTIVAFADRIVGFPHHLSIHCGGIVISPETIDTYVPLEAATKGIAVTQYEMRAIEDIGLVKIDLLGNRGLSAVREAVEILKDRSGIELKPEEFPDGDADTMKLIQRGQTIGCCQLESPAMRHLLLMLRPESVRGVIQALALIRPAPASIGMKEAFVRRARGLEPAQFPHPSVKDVLGDTYGIMLYEDDAMLVASTLAGLSLEEGDRVRKAIKERSTKEKLI
ncbi:MAG: DNA polymerase III subunit alpha, partial [Planctomycetia bacterium]|nr:DNA polymerase III subunit alpha [Planctomycetia bacterium]